LDGYVHAKFFIPPVLISDAAASADVVQFVCRKTAYFVVRILRYHGWDSLDDTESEQLYNEENLERRALDWAGSRAADGAASRLGDRPPVKQPSQTKLNDVRWMAQGVENVGVRLLGYSNVQTWEGQLMPEVRLFRI